MRTLARGALAAVISGVVGGIAYLIMVQGSFQQGYTDLDFNHVLGTLIKGTAEEKRAVSDAFAVVGDTAGPTGLYATLAGGVGLMILYGLVTARLVPRHWTIQGLALGLVTSLVVGFGFCGIADARLDTPTGLFGVDAGGITPLVLVLSSLGFGLVGARCYGLAMSASWWQPKEQEDFAATIESVSELQAPDGSLELAEEGPEQRRVGA